MDYKNLYNFIANANAGIIANLETAKEHKMNKKGNPLYGRVTKIAECRYQIGYNYESGVNRRLSAQGDKPEFKTSHRPYGKWVILNKIAEHNGELYLRVYTIDNCQPSEHYLVDGRPATQEELDIIAFFTPKHAAHYSNTQAAAGLTAHQVEPKEFKFSTIRAITCSGTRHEIEHTQPATAAVAK